MTIAKLISCEIDDDSRMAFSRSQSAWSRLAHCAGFGGQFGGWRDDHADAVIVGLWESQAHVAQFMNGLHDEIADESRQRQSYRKCDVSYFELDSTILAPQSAISNIKLLRIAHCRGVLDEARFMRDQAQIWNPAMSQQPGMSGGHVWRNISDQHSFMVLTYWTSAEAHQLYCDSVFPGLREKARPADYIEKISGAVVAMAREWDVIPENGFNSVAAFPGTLPRCD